MGACWGELVVAARRLLRRPGFTALTVVVLASGIGGAGAAASLYYQVVMAKLPVARPEQLVAVRLTMVAGDGRAGSFGRFSLTDFEELRHAARPAVELLAFARGEAVLAVAGAAERVGVEWVSANYFDLLGVRPPLGRPFAAGGARGADGAAVVLSHAAWTSRFAGDRSAVGQTVLLDGEPLTVVGVAPRFFAGLRLGRAAAVYRLAEATPAESMSFQIFGRLAPGVTAERAQEILRAAHAALSASQPARQYMLILDGKPSRATPRLDVVAGARGESDLRGHFARALLLVGAMFAIVLVVLCTNVANLLAARASAERLQAAVRRALGASRARLALGWLAESLLLAGMGGIGGLVVMAALVPVLAQRLGAIEPVGGLALHFSPPIFLMVAGMVVLVALLVGGLAAIDAARESALARLRGEGPQATGGRRSLRWRWALVATQVGLSLVLLVGTNLLLRSLGRLLDIDTGLPLTEVLALRADLAGESVERRPQLLAELRRELEALPGVQHVAFTEEPILEGSASYVLASIEGYRPAAGETLLVNSVPVSPGFFEALDLRARRGRVLDAADADRGAHVAVVTQRFAERYFAGRDPVGARLSLAFDRDWSRADEGDLEIVGVVADRRLVDVREAATERIFPLADPRAKAVTFYLRSAVPPAALAPQVARRLRQVAPQVAVGDLRSLAEQRDTLLRREHLLSDLAILFAGLATLLSALGLYAVLAYSVTRRAREFGLRLALGARPRDLVGLVATHSLSAVLTGLGAGIAAAVPATRLVRSFLYSVEPDPLAYGTAVVVLAAAAAVAGLLPARRAARLEPMAALRQE